MRLSDSNPTVLSGLLFLHLQVMSYKIHSLILVGGVVSWEWIRIVVVEIVAGSRILQ